jgi:hypothetical protein
MVYTMEVIGTKKVGKKLTEKTIKINQPNGMIQKEDLGEIITSLNNSASKKFNGHKIMVRGENIQQVFTLKGYNDSMDGIDDVLDDYYVGRVNETGKFDDFFNLFVTIIY